MVMMKDLFKSKYFEHKDTKKIINEIAKIVKTGKVVLNKKPVDGKVRGCAFTITSQRAYNDGKYIHVTIEATVKGNTKYLRSGSVWEASSFPPSKMGFGGTFTEVQLEGWTEEKGGPVRYGGVFKV